jgi:glycerol-3-phosphate acyltransferase PlsX
LTARRYETAITAVSAAGRSCEVPAMPSSARRHEDLQEQLKPPDGGVFLGLNGTVIKSHGGSTPEGFADAINLG